MIEKVHKQVVHWGRFVWLAALFSAMLAACTNGGSIGPRPAQDLITVVEAYLQKYQPGPLPRLFQTTYLYDRNGTLIAEYFPEGRRTWAPIARISPYLLQATIAAEDSSFYANPGVDPRRIVAAVVRNIESGEVTSGASTITMQLARNLFLGAEDRYNTSIDRKLLEAGVAQELTDLFSKDEILEMYLNLLNYGSLAYGPEAAAQVYFWQVRCRFDPS
ncbi:MAG: transglycosylase domain-containing protein [Caldilineaceae bacterium]|nr:transglycosylase domain-containing protein [Caldilineaceae bacterium]